MLQAVKHEEKGHVGADVKDEALGPGTPKPYTPRARRGKKSPGAVADTAKHKVPQTTCTVLPTPKTPADIKPGGVRTDDNKVCCAICIIGNRALPLSTLCMGNR